MQKVYAVAARYEGTLEWRDGHNPQIVEWFEQVGHSWVQDDETPWCAAFVGAMLKEAGLPHTGKLNARSYLGWGAPVSITDAHRGDVAVFSRGNPKGPYGHVALIDRIEDDEVFVLGGNQSDTVNISPYPMHRLLGIRRMPSVDPEPQPTASRWRDAFSQLLKAWRAT